MKKLFILILILAQATLTFSQIQVRLVQPGGETGVLRVQFRSVDAGVLPTTSDIFSDMSFRLWWNDPAIIDVDVVTANTYAGMLNEQNNPVPGLSGGSSGTQGSVVTFGFIDAPQPNFPNNWVVNQWITAATVNICSVLDCTSGGPPAGIDATDFVIQPLFQFIPNLGISFNDFTPGIGPLPLNLISFYATKSGDRDAHLTWTTANEENTSHFIVERSFDKQNWETVGSVGAAGNSVDIRNYELTDLEVNNGRTSRVRAYYRLKMFDLDGRSTTSPIESIIYDNGSVTAAVNNFEVFPNPASDGVYVTWDKVENLDQPSLMELYDITGKLVYRQVVADKANQEYIDLESANIKSGVYVLRIMNGTTPLDHKQIVVGQ